MTDNQDNTGDNQGAGDATGLGETAAVVADAAAEPQQQDPQARIDEVEAELATVKQQLADALAAAEKAKRAASASAGKAAAKARKISARDVVDAIEATGEGDDALTREQALLLAIGEAGTVEVVLSNGKTEIIAIPPIAIHGDAWRVSMVGVQLTIPELIVHGPAPGQSAYALNGYGLLLDGTLRAYMARGEQLSIAGGSNNNVAPDIVF